MNNVPSDDSSLKRPLSILENGSNKNHIQQQQQVESNITKGMSKDFINPDNQTEDGEGSEAETVVMPGKDLDSPSSKKTIRHEGANSSVTSSTSNNVAGGGTVDGSRSNTANGSHTTIKISRSARQESTTEMRSADKSNNPHSPHTSPSTVTVLHDHQQNQQHRSRSRATSESSKQQRHDSDNNKSGVSRKRKVSIDGSEDKSIKRRIKREDNDTNSLTEPKKFNIARSESPSRPRATSTVSTPNPSSVQKQKRKTPAPLAVGTNGRRKLSIDGDSNESQSPRHSTVPRLVHAADSEMLKGKKKDKNGRTRVARACATNNLEEVREYLKIFPEELDEPDNAGNTPLQIASLEGNLDIVRLLLRKGCKVDTENCDRDSPLIDSVENSHLEVIRLLLEAGVNPRKVNAKGEEPLDLVDMEHENGPDIKEELSRYRTKYDSKRRQSTEKAPDNGKESTLARSPRGSPTITARSPPPQGTRRRAGRSEVTRNDLLWITATPENLIDFAGKGDDQAIIHLLNMRPVSDTKAVFAAAKGGHDGCLNLLLAMGKTDADPEPLEDQKKGYNTPMLVAIGKGTPRIVELLLEQPNFDPTRRLYKNMTYYEIAEKRQGEGWKGEYKKLKTAYDEKMSRDGKRPSHKGNRTSSPKDTKKSQKDHSPSTLAVREPSPATNRNGIPPRSKVGNESKPDRPKEKVREKEEHRSDRKHLKVPKHESREVSITLSDREPSPSLSIGKRSASDHEATPRPRKRLVSGKDRKDAQTKQRRGSFMSTVSTSSATDSIRQKSSQEDKNVGSEVEKDKNRSRRSISPPQTDTIVIKRPRINSDTVTVKPASGPAKVASMARNTQSSGAAPVAAMGPLGGDRKENRPSPKDTNGHGVRKEKTAKPDGEDKPKVRAKDKASRTDTSSTDKPDSERRRTKENKHTDRPEKPRSSQADENSEIMGDNPATQIKREAVESPVKHSPPELKNLESRSLSPDNSAVIEDDMETAPTESGSVVGADKNLSSPDKLDSDRSPELDQDKKLAEEQGRIAAEAEHSRQIREEEEASRLKEAQEHQRKLDLEAERQRYLDTLPRVFRDLVNDPEEAKTDVALKRWMPILCASGIEVDAACPEAERDEKWITNFQAAALLVETDLSLSNYSSWSRKPLVAPLKQLVWRNMCWQIHRWTMADCPNVRTACHPTESYRNMKVNEAKWHAMEMFWIRLSDFEAVIPQYPHLQGLKRTIIMLSPAKVYEDLAAKIEEAEKNAPINVAWRNFLITPRPTESPVQSLETPPTPMTA